MGAFLRPDGYAGPRGLQALSREGSTVVEAVRLVRRRVAERSEQRNLPYAGQPSPQAVEPVMLVPGFLAGDSSLNAMSLWLRRKGWRTYRSGIHVNVGCTQEVADRLERRVEAISLRRGRSVTIVGHSLGGMLARGLASRRPDLVAGIVTMGSPVLAPAAVHPVLAWDAGMLTQLSRAGFGGVMSQDCVAGTCARRSFEETNQPLNPAVGYTAVYSRRDGVVDWKACLDPAALQVEVRTSHCGMAFDPVVFDVVLDALQGQQLSRASRLAARSEVAG